MTENNHRTGYYTDTEEKGLACCAYNDTDKLWPFFEARWGPHGLARPGQWMVTDAGGFSIAVNDRDFAERFEWSHEIPSDKPETTEA